MTKDVAPKTKPIGDPPHMDTGGRKPVPYNAYGMPPPGWKPEDNPIPPRAELLAYWSNEPTPYPDPRRQDDPVMSNADFDRHRTQENQTPRVKECGDFPGPRDNVSATLAFDEATRLAADIMAEFREKHGLAAIGECSGLAAINDAMRECAEEINAIARGVDQARISPEAGRLALAWYLDPATIERFVTVPGTRVRWL